MKFKKVTKTLKLGDYHPDFDGVEFELWVNPPRRLIRDFFSGEEERANNAFAELLGITQDDIDAMPNLIAGILVGVADHRGLVWVELDKYRDELLKNFGSGSGSSKTE